MAGSRRAHAVGSALAVAGALCYGVTIVIGRSLARSGIAVSTALGIRFGIAGLALFVVLVATRRPLVPVVGERLATLGLGAIGYAFESTLFYLALSHGTAAAVSLLFYSYPAMVTVADSALHRTRPRRATVIALALSFTGAALLATSGGRVDITAVGALFALSSAASFGAYLLASAQMIRRTESLTTGAWVAIGASASLLTRAQVLGGVSIGASHNWQLLTYGLSTGAAFACMFAALRRLGPAQTAVVMTLEAVCAIALAAVFLHEGIGPIQVVGGAAILGAAVLISVQSGGHGSASEAPASVAAGG